MSKKHLNILASTFIILVGYVRCLTSLTSVFGYEHLVNDSYAADDNSMFAAMEAGLKSVD